MNRKVHNEHMQSTDQVRLLARILNTAPFSIVATDANGRITYVNQATEKLFGYHKNELLGTSPQILNAEPDADTIQREILDTAAQGQIWTGEILNRDKQGRIFPVSATVYRLVDDNGSFLALVGFQKDATAEKTAERALRESEARWRSLSEFSPDHIMLFDTAANILFINHTVPGLTPADVVGRSVYDFLGRDRAAARKCIERVLHTGQADEHTSAYSFPDGSRHFFESRVGPVRNGDKIVGLSVCSRDVTDRKTAERLLSAYQVRLRSLASQLCLSEERERRRIATVLHDQVGQNLAMAQIKLGTLVDRMLDDDLSQTVAEVRAMCREAIKYTRSLTAELSPPVLHELGFEAGIEWLVDKMDSEVDGVQSTFKDDGVSKPLEANLRILAFQAIRELLVNVVKHADARNVQVSLRLTGDHLRIEVADDGSGFDVAEETANQGPEAGFGLFAIRERLDNMGGRLELTSEPEKGTHAVVVVPVLTEVAVQKGGGI